MKPVYVKGMSTVRTPEEVHDAGVSRTQSHIVLHGWAPPKDSQTAARIIYSYIYILYKWCSDSDYNYSVLCNCVYCAHFYFICI